MAISDYIPNVFGVENPTYSGLLGEDQSNALKSSSNIAGLLGGASALAQGMGAGGSRRSAAANIINALAGAYGAAGQSYQQGLQSYGQQQQLAMQQRQQAGVQAMKNKYPDLADEFDTNPAGAFRIVAEREAAAKKPTVVSEGGTLVSPTGDVLYSSTKNKPQARIMTPDEVMQYQLPTGAGQKYQVDATGKISPIEGTLPAKELKPESFTGDYGNLAMRLFGTADLSKLTEQQRMNLGKEAERLGVGKGQNITTNIDIGSKEMEKEFAKGVVEDTRASFAQAKSAVNTIKTIERLKPIISAGVYEGVLSSAPKAVDQIATALGVSGKDTKEKLQRTAVAMQGLASLELTAAEAMKGQGAITENERTLIARAAGGNLSTFTSGEVQALLDSLDKVARFKVQSHQQNFEIMNSDPIGKKYSKYYKLDIPSGQQSTQPRVRTYNPATGRIE